MSNAMIYSAEIDIRARNLPQTIKQIQKGIGSVKGTVDVGLAKGAKSDINTLNKTLNKTNSELKTTNRLSREATDSIKAFGKQSALAIRRFAAFTVITSGFIDLSRAIKNSVAEAVKFERELIKISQVTGRTVGGLNNLVNEITRLSTGLGVSSNSLLAASRTLSQTGIAADQVRIALKAIALADLSPTFDSINDTTEGSIAIFRQFGIAADGLEKKLSAINSVSKSFAIESADITTAIRRGGGAFAAAGGNLEQYIALLTSVRSTTRESAESIATGFRTIFTRLQRTRTQNFLRDAGIDLKGTVGGIENQFVGGFEAVRRLSQGLQQLPSTDPRFAQIIEELGGFRQITKVIPLIQQFGVAQKALAVAQANNNSLAEDAAVAQEALSVKIQKVREDFEALIRTIAGSEAFKFVTSAILGMTSALIKLSDALVPLLPALTLLGTVSTARLAGRFFGGSGGFIQTLSNSSPSIRRNRGGSVPGMGNTDSVHALLTPGEFVLNKEAVRRIGSNNLERVNSNARFNKGGMVGKPKRFNLGGLVTGRTGLGLAGGSAIASVILQSTSIFGNMNEELTSVINTIAGVGVQFAILTALTKNNNIQLNKSNDVVKEARKNILPTGRDVRRAEARRSTSVGLLEDSIEREDIEKSKLRKKRRRLQVEAARATAVADANPTSLTLGNIARNKRTFAARFRRGQTSDFDNLREIQADQAILRQRVASDDNTVNAARRRRTEARNRFRSASRRSSIIRGATTGLLGAGVGLGVGGEFLSSAGSANIQAGGTSTTQSALGGALSGAASGAAIGAFLGPLGSAAGAAIFGLTGYVKALKSAEAEIQQVKIGAALQDFTGVLDSISAGRATAQENAFRVSTSLRNIRRLQLEAASDPEASQNIRSDINQRLPGVKLFLSQLAESSKTFEDFSAAGQEALSFLALQQNIPIAELNEEFRNQIDGQNRLRLVTEENIAQRQRETQRLRELNVISIAVANSFRQLERVQSGLRTELGLASGSPFGSNFSNRAAGFSSFSDIANINDFENIARDMGNLFGDAGQRLAEEIVESAQVSKALPDILAKLRDQDPLGIEGEFIPRLREALDSAPELIKSAILAQAKEVVGDEGKDITIINEARKDIIGLSRRLVSNVEDTLGKAFVELGDELAKRKNLLSSSLGQLQSTIDQANNFRFRAVDAAQQRRAAQLGRELTPAESSEEFNRKLDILVQGGPRTVSAIQNRLTGAGGAQARFRESRQRLDELRVGGGDGVQEAAQEFQEAALEVSRLTNAMKFLANSTIRVKNAQDELAKQRAQRETNTSLLSTLAFGTPKEQGELAKQIGALNVLLRLNETGNLAATPKAVAQAALPFIQQNQEATFQGVKLKDLNKNLLKALTPDSLKGFLSPGEAEKTAQQQLVDSIKVMEEANTALADNTETALQGMINKLDGLFSSFVNDMRQAFLRSEEAAAKNAVEQAQADKARLDQSQKQNVALANRLGIRPNQLSQARSVLGTTGEIRRIERREAGFSRLADDLRPGGNPFRQTFINDAVSRVGGTIDDAIEFDKVRKSILDTLIASGFTQDEAGIVGNQLDKTLGGREGTDAVQIVDSIGDLLRNTISSGLKDADRDLIRLTNSLAANTSFSPEQLRGLTNISSSDREALLAFDPKVNKNIEENTRKAQEKLNASNKLLADIRAQMVASNAANNIKVGGGPVAAKKPVIDSPIAAKKPVLPAGPLTKEERFRAAVAKRQEEAEKRQQAVEERNKKRAEQEVQLKARENMLRAEREKRGESPEAKKTGLLQKQEEFKRKEQERRAKVLEGIRNKQSTATASDASTLLGAQDSFKRREAERRRAVVEGIRNKQRGIQQVPSRGFLNQDNADKLRRALIPDSNKGFLNEENGKLLRDSFSSFDSAASKMLKAGEKLETVPSEITHNGRVSVELIINGAEVLTGLMPAITTIIEEKLNQSTSSIISDMDLGTDSAGRLV